MPETDRQTDTTTKTTRWAFTAYEGQWDLFKTMPPTIAEWGFQQEVCPDTQRPHYQGYLRTKQQVRLSQLCKQLPGVHLEPAKNWSALTQYCNKTESAVPGTQVHQVSQTHNIYTLSMSIAQALPLVSALKENYEDERERVRKAAPRGVQPPYETYYVDSWEAYLLRQVELEVRARIRDGNCEYAWTATNPQWISMWKKYGEDFIVGAQKNL